MVVNFLVVAECMTKIQRRRIYFGSQWEGTAGGYENTGHTVPHSQEAELHMLEFTWFPFLSSGPRNTAYPVNSSGNILRHTSKTPKIRNPVDQLD